MNKIYITGVAGLLGSNLAKFLISNGYIVRGCDNLIGGYADNIPPKVEFACIDIMDFDKLNTHMQGCDVVIHAAALPYEGLSVFSPAMVTSNIVGGTTNVAAAAINNKYKRFVFCSSMARYGDQTPPFKEDYLTKGVDPYGKAKIQAEEMLYLLSDIHGLEVTVVVPHNIIGIGQRYTDPFRNVAAIMINSAFINDKIIIYGDGNQKRSFSNISDCVDAISSIALSTRNLNKAVYNIGPDDNEITINHLSEIVIEEVTPLKRSGFVSIQYVPDRPREVKLAFCSSEKIKKDFNYHPKKDIEKTIHEMTNWIHKRGVQPFDYHLPIEINSEIVPVTWKEKLF